MFVLLIFTPFGFSLPRVCFLAQVGDVTGAEQRALGMCGIYPKRGRDVAQSVAGREGRAPGAEAPESSSHMTGVKPNRGSKSSSRSCASHSLNVSFVNVYKTVQTTKVRMMSVLHFFFF